MADEEDVEQQYLQMGRQQKSEEIGRIEINI